MNTTSALDQKQWYQCYHGFRQAGYRPSSSALLASGCTLHLSSFLNNIMYPKEAS